MDKVEDVEELVRQKVSPSPHAEIHTNLSKAKS
jgi:hypothetical protein